MNHDVVSMLQKLLACPSVTPEDAGVISVLESYLTPFGFSCERMRFEEPGTAPVVNLVARIGTTGPHLGFAGHTDVVPVGDALAWCFPPFGGKIHDGRLYGRGAVDMKGAIAAFVAAVIEVIKEVTTLPGSISFIITGDEEASGINGTKKMLPVLKELHAIPDHCIVGEPTNPMVLGEMVKIGRRGSITFKIIAEGVQGHVAYPDLADNPIPDLVRLLQILTNETLDEGNMYFPPSHLEVTTVDVCNPVTNIIPAKASATCNIRFNSLHTTASLTSWVKDRSRRISNRFHIEVLPGSCEAFITEPGFLSDLVVNAITTVTGRKPVLSTTGGTSDARFIKDYCPVVEFGLINQTAHKVDEHIEVNALEELVNIYKVIIMSYFKL